MSGTKHFINHRWFASRLEDKRLSQRQFAKQIGLDPSAVTLLFQGKRAMKMSEAAKIANLLGVPVSDVLQNAGLPTGQGGAKEVTLVGWVDGDSEVHFQPQGPIPAPQALPDNCVAVQCRTAMTTQEHMDGWVLFYEQPNGHQIDYALNKNCIVKLRNGVTLMAYLKRGYTPGKFNLYGAAHIMDADLEYATPVLWIKTQ
jgi:transcriptional regulator with XRE-family HTH domain